MSSSNSTRLTGVVKWFNKKQGYGFINVLNGDDIKGKDIFVHYSSLRTSYPYKYLVQGEYIEFLVEKSNKENHELHAVDITGIFENQLLCEARQISK